jgi:hypothetical protein
MKSDKPVIRRTLSQERFEVLIKKQLEGRASFKDLTELDEIVNRDPDIRLTILEEMEGKDNSNDDITAPQIPLHQPEIKQNLTEKIKIFIDRLFRFTPGMTSLT